MLTVDELRQQVSPRLRGSKRVVIDGRIEKKARSTDADRRRTRKWSAEHKAQKRAYQAAYDAARRPAANARVERFAKKNPERRKKQLRAAATKYWHKKMAAARYMALLIAFATSFGGAR